MWHFLSAELGGIPSDVTDVITLVTAALATLLLLSVLLSFLSSPRVFWGACKEVGRSL